MKVLISDKMDPRCVEILEANDGIAVDVRSGLSPSALLACIGDYEGLVVRSATKVTAEVLAAAPRLRVIGRAGTGFDNIDVEAATRHGVIVMNTPGGNSLSTAEHTFALIASLARHIPQATATLKEGLWERSQFVGVELAGKTLAVVGLGRVGREVAARATAFRMKVLGYDPYIGQEMALSYGAHLTSLDKIYATADFITVHTHLSDQTRHLISDAEIAQCKDGVYLINCARGGIMDEAALLRGLNSGKVAGAALDVFEEEPPTLVDLLVDDRVICTPHLAASTKEAQANVALQVAEQVGDVLMGRVIRNAVNAPSVDPEIHGKLQPYLVLAERLGRLQAQLGEGQLERITIEYQGDITAYPTSPLTSAVLKGIMETVSDAAVNVVNALLSRRSAACKSMSGSAASTRTTPALSPWCITPAKGSACSRARSSARATRASCTSTSTFSTPSQRATCSFTSTTMSRASSAKSARSWAATMSTSPKCRVGVAKWAAKP